MRVQRASTVMDMLDIARDMTRFQGPALLRQFEPAVDGKTAGGAYQARPAHRPFGLSLPAH